MFLPLFSDAVPNTIASASVGLRRIHEVGCEKDKWIELAKVRAQRQLLVLVLLNIRIILREVVSFDAD